VTPLRIGLAVAAGLALAALPFLRYLHLGHPALPHSDHAPRHGGALVMVGEHHVELLRKDGRFEVFVSDATRQPVAVSEGWVTRGERTRVPLEPHGDRLAAPGADRSAVEVTVILPDGTPVRARFGRVD
jgi:hypothetical protein